MYSVRRTVAVLASARTSPESNDMPHYSNCCSFSFSILYIGFVLLYLKFIFIIGPFCITASSSTAIHVGRIPAYCNTFPGFPSRRIAYARLRCTRMPSFSSSVATSGPTYISSDLVPSWFRRERCRLLTTPQTSHKVQNTLRDDGGATATAGCVIYWMQRDMRTVDNWAMLLTQHLASEHFQVPMRVLYTMPPPYTVSPRPSSSSSSPPCYTNMTARHASFLLGGLQSVEEELRELHVPFDILFPTYETPLTSGMEIPTKMFVKSSITADVKTYVQSHQACAIVTDFSPLRHIRDWTEEFASAMTLDNITIPIYQVDAHNIVPVWLASNKKEVGARTLRPRIHKLLPDFLTTYPSIIGNKKDRRETAGQQQAANSTTFESRPIIDWKKCEDFLQPDVSVPPVSTWAKPGTKSGMAQFEFFCRKGLSKYSDLRNDPTQDNICSSMSPWTNYGHVSFQTLALSIKALKVHTNAAASFLEEGIVRRELSDNFCFYCKDGYDSIDGGAADWAKDSLALHERDPREYIYTLEEFMNGETHDDLWNAAQMQVVQTGKMHGFLRMYWAKKILEWTPNATMALQIGLYLNDRFALDGNDPNGFVGVGWSIMGVHDMGWKERPIFGKIRYMNYEGCKRKFKVATFVAKYPKASTNAKTALSKKEKHPISSFFTTAANNNSSNNGTTNKKLSGSKRKN